MQRVDEQCEIEPFRFRVELVEARVPEDDAVDVAADLYATEAIALQTRQFGGGERRIL